jgi:glyoxylase-like metal-dependent hydrolase (beta-lactamase superfamily II)
MSIPAVRSRVTIGNTTVTYLPDGYTLVNPAVMFSQGAPDWANHSDHLDVHGRLMLSGGSFLIESDGRRILFDLGSGDTNVDIPDVAQSRNGQLLDSLAGAGLRPEDVDTVVFSHLHLDHVGWTSTGGRLTFPRARHLVSAAEWEFWTGPDNPGGVSGPDVDTVLNPLQGRIEFVEDGDAVAPGVIVRATPGHTPGHVSLIVVDPVGVQPGRVAILGDVLHWSGQLVERDVVFAADADPGLAKGSREKLLEEYVDSDTIVAAGHFAEHVFGRLTNTSSGLTWTPIASSATLKSRERASTNETAASVRSTRHTD